MTWHIDIMLPLNTLKISSKTLCAHELVSLILRLTVVYICTTCTCVHTVNV